MMSRFSSPPMRWARPGVPGIAHGPRAVLVAGVGLEGLVRRLREVRVDLRQRAGVGDPPRLARVGQEQVGEQDHRRAVADGDPRRLVGGLEALARRGGRHHRQRRLAVAAVDGHQQVRLLGLGRHAGRRAGALHVDDDQRQLERDRQPDRLGLEVHARAARGGDAEAAAERRAQRHAGGGDLVLGLDRPHAEVLVPRELVQQLGGGRDRVAGEHERQAGPDAGGQQAERGGRRAVDVAVGAGRDVGRRVDAVLDVDQLGGLAEVPAGAEGGEVGLQRARLVDELAPQPVLGRLRRAVVEPRDDAEREQVLGAPRVARRDALHRLGRARRQRRHRDPDQVVAVERAVLERVGLVARLLQVALAERVLVGDHRPALGERRQLAAQRGGVHGDEHVRLVARREDVLRREVDLERGDAGERAGRRADLGREARERREVVAVLGGGVREAAAGELHAVTRIARKADDYPLACLHRTSGDGHVSFVV